MSGLRARGRVRSCVAACARRLSQPSASAPMEHATPRLRGEAARVSRRAAAGARRQRARHGRLERAARTTGRTGSDRHCPGGLEKDACAAHSCQRGAQSTRQRQRRRGQPHLAASRDCACPPAGRTVASAGSNVHDAWHCARGVEGVRGQV